MGLQQLVPAFEEVPELGRHAIAGVLAGDEKQAVRDDGSTPWAGPGAAQRAIERWNGAICQPRGSPVESEAVAS